MHTPPLHVMSPAFFFNMPLLQSKPFPPSARSVLVHVSSADAVVHTMLSIITGEYVPSSMRTFFTFFASDGLASPFDAVIIVLEIAIKMDQQNS